MNMVVAQNQAMTALIGAPSVIYTDPIELGDNDRATVMWMIHYLWAWDSGGGAANALASYETEVSNNAMNWVPIGAAGNDSSNAALPNPLPKTFAANGQFIRFKLTLNVTLGTLAGVAFDLHVKFDHI